MKTRSGNVTSVIPVKKKKTKTPRISNTTLVQVKNQPVRVQNQMTQTEMIDKAANDEELKKQLQELYENIKAAPSYSAKITKFLRHNDVHSKFSRVVKRNFTRRRVIVRFPFELFMADLIDYQYYRHANKGYRYILLVIDCFTKMIYVEPLKRKTMEASATAIENILARLERFPTNFVTDAGREFFNTKAQAVFESYGINHYKIQSKSKMKAMIAERAIRTIKSKLEKYFYKHKNRKWIDVIDDIVSNYNKLPHSTTGYPPIEVTAANQNEIFKKMYPKKSITVSCRLQKGDKVRKIIEKKYFSKGYTQNWSDEIYQVADVFQSNTVCWYKLAKLDNEKLEGIYYYNQLKLVAKNDN